METEILNQPIYGRMETKNPQLAVGFSSPKKCYDADSNHAGVEDV